MKTTILILTLMCNACYGQDTAFYNTSMPNYPDSTIHGENHREVIDTILYNHDSSIITVKTTIKGKEYGADTIKYNIIPQKDKTKTAKLHIKAATSGKQYPLKFSPGKVLPLPDSGTIEYSGKDIYYTPNHSRRKLYDSVTMYGNEQPVYHRKKDTIPCAILTSDTALTTFVVYPSTLGSLGDSSLLYKILMLCDKINDSTYQWYDNKVNWQMGYSVREFHKAIEGFVHSGMTPLEWQGYWKHLYYLNSNKELLSGNVVVWQSMEVK